MPPQWEVLLLRAAGGVASAITCDIGSNCVFSTKYLPTEKAYQGCCGPDENFKGSFQLNCADYDPKRTGAATAWLATSF